MSNVYGWIIRHKNQVVANCYIDKKINKYVLFVKGEYPHEEEFTDVQVAIKKARQLRVEIKKKVKQ